jgi:hypothetical protein
MVRTQKGKPSRRLGGRAGRGAKGIGLSGKEETETLKLDLPWVVPVVPVMPRKYRAIPLTKAFLSRLIGDPGEHLCSTLVLAVFHQSHPEPSITLLLIFKNILSPLSPATS